jgi:hypothetical protein
MDVDEVRKWLLLQITTLSEPGETTVRLKQSRQTISRIGQVYNRWFKLPRSVKHSLVSESFPLTCIYLDQGH